MPDTLSKIRDHREPSTNRPVLVMLVGHKARTVVDELVAANAPGEFVSAMDASTAIAWVERAQREPAILVVVQDWPGEVAPADVQRLRIRLPLARVCARLGSWCEGEARSGHPWPGVRIYTHQWPQRSGRALSRLALDLPSEWTLPITASEEERLLGDPTTTARTDATIIVVAQSPAAADALADGCRSLGYSAVVLRSTQGAAAPTARAVVWDTSIDQASDPAKVAEVKLCAACAPIVAICGFPRPEDFRQIKAAGIAAVLSKPFLLADLAWQLAALDMPVAQGYDARERFAA